MEKLLITTMYLGGLKTAENKNFEWLTVNGNF